MATHQSQSAVQFQPQFHDIFQQQYSFPARHQYSNDTKIYTHIYAYAITLHKSLLLSFVLYQEAWHSGKEFQLLNEVTVQRAARARLVLRWVTAWGQVNHLGM